MNDKNYAGFFIVSRDNKLVFIRVVFSIGETLRTANFSTTVNNLQVDATTGVGK